MLAANESVDKLHLQCLPITQTMSEQFLQQAGRKNKAWAILQAFWHNPASAKRLSYRQLKTQEIITELQQNSSNISNYEDFLHGSDYLENVRNSNIQDSDMVLMFLLDGAQLYAHKSSANNTKKGMYCQVVLYQDQINQKIWIHSFSQVLSPRSCPERGSSSLGCVDKSSI